MTGGQIAGLIAAIAFLILVLFIGMLLTRMTRTLGEMNVTIRTMTEDVDVISKQAEELMANANVLLEDVNQKVATIDPVFKAAADLGESVSDLNTATRHLTERVTDRNKNRSRFSLAARVGQSVFSFLRHRRQKPEE